MKEQEQTTAPDVVYSNEWYDITVSKEGERPALDTKHGTYKCFYVVRNNQHNVEELYTNVLVEAISYAESAKMTLQKSPWTWYQELVGESLPDDQNDEDPFVN